MTERPTFKRAFQTRRCLIPASGFFEWRKEEGGKVPIYFRRIDREPFAFAGIWDEWQGPSGKLRTCCIVTVPPNGLVEPIHDRMPAILRPEVEAPWLESTDTETALSLLRPYPETELEAFPVSRRVGSPRNEDPSLIVPDGSAQARLF